MFSLGSIDTVVPHKSLILESYTAEVLKLKSKYRTEVTGKLFILKVQLTKALTCFLSKLDAVADLSSWVPRLVVVFYSRGTLPLELSSPASVDEHTGVLGAGSVSGPL